jgi:hypothetical protein
MSHVLAGERIAGTTAGGHVRTITPPLSTDPRLEAVRAVLMSWCTANGLRPGRMLDRDRVEIHPLDAGELARDRHEILWREVTDPEPGQPGRGREARTQLRRTPLLVEPAGLLSDDLTCGHVRIEPSPVLGAPALLYVCDEHIDPATGRHPAAHAGDWAGEHRLPAGDWAGEPRPPRAEGTPPRLVWDNEQPGDLPFRDGLPYLGDMDPHIAHALVLDRLNHSQAETERRRGRPGAVAAAIAHLAGLRRVAERHAPRTVATPAAGGPLCERRCSGWPCPDYRDALAGVVTFAPAAAR